MHKPPFVINRLDTFVADIAFIGFQYRLNGGGFSLCGGYDYLNGQIAVGGAWLPVRHFTAAIGAIDKPCQGVKNPNVAIAHGIGMVHQHFMLVDNFTVTQNIVLGQETTKACGVMDMKKARQEVLRIVEKYGLEVDPDAYISDISVGMQQRVEILKALYRGGDILILDEPTAVLTPQEITDLIEIMHRLVEDGKNRFKCPEGRGVIRDLRGKDL